MTDRRLWAANGHVAHSALIGRVEAARFTDGEVQSVTAPWADLCITPRGARDCQLLFGHRFTVLDRQEGWAFGFGADGYVGYVEEKNLGPPTPVSHRVSSRLTHVYSAPDIKSPERATLSFGADLSLSGAQDGFHSAEGGGFVPTQHVQPCAHAQTDPAGIAQLFEGTPYLWGGNTGTGIDCSGLVQLALNACAIPCPRDSDMQEAAFPEIGADAAGRGDLIFWHGHVGMLLDARTLIHANAHHMAVVIEPFDQATTRIAQREFGAVTSVRRPIAPKE